MSRPPDETHHPAGIKCIGLARDFVSARVTYKFSKARVKPDDEAGLLLSLRQIPRSTASHPLTWIKAYALIQDGAAPGRTADLRGKLRAFSCNGELGPVIARKWGWKVSRVERWTTCCFTKVEGGYQATQRIHGDNHQEAFSEFSFPDHGGDDDLSAWQLRIEPYVVSRGSDGGLFDAEFKNFEVN